MLLIALLFSNNPLMNSMFKESIIIKCW